MAPNSVQLSLLRNLVIQRLGDASFTFWSANEIDDAIYEALNYYAVVSGSLRSRFAVSLPAGADGWVDLAIALGSLRARTITYGQLVAEIEAALLQPITGSISAPSPHVPNTHIAAALYHRRNLLVAATDCSTARVSPTVISPPNLYFASRIARIHRLVYRETRSGHTTPIWPSDEYAQYQSMELPSFSPTGGDLTELRVLPYPAPAGVFEAVATVLGEAPPAFSSDPLNIPDELAWIAKWGALAELFATSSDRADPQRAQMADLVWQTGLLHARAYHPLLTAYVNGRPSNLTTLQQLDATRPGWDGGTQGVFAPGSLIADPTVAIATHQLVVIAGHNRSRPVSLSGSILISPGRPDPLPVLADAVEPISAIATAFAAFKQGGAEAMLMWQTAQQHLPFIDLARRESTYESVMLDNPRKPGRNPVDNALKASDEASQERRFDSH